MYHFKFITTLLLSILFIFSYKQANKTGFSQVDFPNILDLKNVPHTALDEDASCFFDLGAWHGFALIPDSAKKQLGGFSGPFLMESWRWLSKNLLKVTLEDVDTSEKLDLAKSELLKANIFQDNYYKG